MLKKINRCERNLTDSITKQNRKLFLMELFSELHVVSKWVSTEMYKNGSVNGSTVR